MDPGDPQWEVIERSGQTTSIIKTVDIYVYVYVYIYIYIYMPFAYPFYTLPSA